MQKCIAPTNYKILQKSTYNKASMCYIDTNLMGNIKETLSYIIESRAPNRDKLIKHPQKQNLAVSGLSTSTEKYIML